MDLVDITRLVIKLYQDMDVHFMNMGSNCDGIPILYRGFSIKILGDKWISISDGCLFFLVKGVILPLTLDNHSP